MKKTKTFDYEIYNTGKTMGTSLMIIIIFILSFLLGMWCKNKEYEDKINKQAIEIVDLKEQIYRNNLKEEMKK